MRGKYLICKYVACRGNVEEYTFEEIYLYYILLPNSNPKKVRYWLPKNHKYFISIA